MIDKLLSNGYVFWGILAGAVVILSIIYMLCNFSFTDYSSRWGRFLLRYNFRKAGKILLWMFILAMVGAVIYGAVNGFEMTGQKGTIFWILFCVSLLSLFAGMLSQVLNYCRWCWGTMPLSRMIIVTLVFGFVYGMYLFFTHPALPDGTIISVLKKTITLSLEREDMLWRENFVLSDFQTYVSLVRTPERWRTILYWFLGLCVVNLLLCNAWMHCRGWFKRILAPVLSCLIAFAAVPVSLVVGFGCFIVAHQISVIVISIVVIWFGIRILVPLLWTAATTPTASSSSGSYSCGGGSSYSPGIGASSGQGGVSTTIIDRNGCEYKGEGKNPETIEKQTPGDHAIFDRRIDGSYRERFGDRTLEKDIYTRTTEE